MRVHYMGSRLLGDSIAVCYMGILQNFKIYVQLDIQIPKDPQSFLSANSFKLIQLLCIKLYFEYFVLRQLVSRSQCQSL